MSLIVGMYTIGYTPSEWYYSSTFRNWNTTGYICIIGLGVSRIIEFFDCFRIARQYNKKLKKELKMPEEAYLSYGAIHDNSNVFNNYIGVSYKF